MNQNGMQLLIIGMVLGAGFVFLLWFVFKLFSPWIKALLSGGQISLIKIIGIRLRGNPVTLLVNTHIVLLHNGQRVSIETIETIYIAHEHLIQSTQDLVELVTKEQAKIK